MNEQGLKDRLQAISKERGINFNECWKKLLLERFLSRLSRSTYTQQFIFKGGFLLAYLMEIGRETTDLDFLLTSINASEDEIKEAIEEVIAIESEDGFSFSYEGIELLEQPHMDYPGYRVGLKATFGRMRDKIQIDVGIGDVVTPTTRELHFFQYKGKPMFEGEISLLVYPSETIFAEKLETVLSKGAANSRMKDYHDLLLLAREPHMINFNKLQVSLKNTFSNRGTTLELIDFKTNELKLMQKLWVAHIKNLGHAAQKLKLPENIQNVIIELNTIIKSIETC
ncbi:nucleotidyl transferase AbiEii/AbiGii toxin family protein [Candidatus Protochlamydia sp. R18]|uniref:nucleotidyl transferase AbiEii/AbiGii toxin family protein n=1 Tax=Candidatus Protochlamydia sp. R18 TaxID=1353977 RepID=UPI0005AAAF28|nr:nucleotidyl transferase AbiEii/AbiGii toxin family protein [Candidatus Protochlamydia sp. R18]